MSTAKYTNKRITREDLVKAVSGEYRTLQSIGDEFGVTRERIRQLIVQHGLQNASGRIKPDSRPTCKECGLKINGNKGRSFHSSCYEKYVWATLSCAQCNKEFKLRKKDLKRRQERRSDWTKNTFFCSRECYGSYWGTRFGFGASISKSWPINKAGVMAVALGLDESFTPDNTNIGYKSLLHKVFGEPMSQGRSSTKSTNKTQQGSVLSSEKRTRNRNHLSRGKESTIMNNITTSEVLNFNPTNRLKMTNDHLQVHLFNKKNIDGSLSRDKNESKNKQLHVIFQSKMLDDFPQDAKIQIEIIQKEVMWKAPLRDLGAVKDIEPGEIIDLSDMIVDRPVESLKFFILVCEGSSVLGRFMSIDRDPGEYDAPDIEDKLIIKRLSLDAEWVKLDPEAGRSDGEDPSILLIDKNMNLETGTFMEHQLTWTFILPNIIRSICYKHLDYMIHAHEDVRDNIIERFEEILSDETVDEYPANLNLQWQKWVHFINYYSKYKLDQKSKVHNSLYLYWHDTVDESKSFQKAEHRKELTDWVENSITNLMETINNGKKISKTKASSYFLKRIE